MRFKAFISYSSADRKIGEQFQRAIEHYRIPAPLQGRDYGFGPIPKRLTPLFRDRSDAAAGADLAETLRAALNDSEALVVLCSPASARSHWVNEEIRAFKSLGRQARIFPVLVDGAPRRHDPEGAPEGAFPPALYQSVDAAGRMISQEAPEPLAPDVRAAGDGLQFAKLKIVAALTGVSLTELTQRQHEAERRERRTARIVTATMSGLAVAASASAVLAWRSAEAARERLANAIEMAARRTDDAAQFGDSYGVPAEVVQRLLAGAERDLDELVGRQADGPPRLQLERARTTVSLANLYNAIGEGDRQVSLAREALAILERVPTKRELLRPSTWLSAPPAEDEVAQERLGALEQLGTALLYSDAGFDESLRVFEHGLQLAAQSRNAAQQARFLSLRGQHLSLSGDLEGALEAYDAAIAIAARERDEASREELSAARAERAEMLMQLERHREALAEQERVTAAFEAGAQSTDTALMRSLGHSLTRQGDMVYAVSGRWVDSVPLYVRAIALLSRVHESDPARIDYARDLSISLERLGDAKLQMGETVEARNAYDRVIALRREVLARNPRHTEAQRDVSVALEKLADLALTTGNAARSASLLQEAVLLRQGAQGEVALEADPILARDLAVLWLKIGRARVRLGGSENWNAAFARSIDLMEAIVEKEDALISWRRDLAAIHAAYGDALAGAGRRGEGAEHWRAALRQVEQQLLVSRDDPRLRRDQRDLRARLGVT